MDENRDPITFRMVAECFFAAAIIGPLMIWIGIAQYD